LLQLGALDHAGPLSRNKTGGGSSVTRVCQRGIGSTPPQGGKTLYCHTGRA
jgi:hypothetical protein